MNNETLKRLQALLARWNALVDDGRRKGKHHDRRFYCGVLFGLETARDDLTEALAAAGEAEVQSVS
ncbi:MAG TPA: hypothetical protein VF982_01885 [Anaerolineales bacterium]